MLLRTFTLSTLPIVSDIRASPLVSAGSCLRQYVITRKTLFVTIDQAFLLLTFGNGRENGCRFDTGTRQATSYFGYKALGER
jgi:hypothetical protein